MAVCSTAKVTVMHRCGTCDTFLVPSRIGRALVEKSISETVTCACVEDIHLKASMIHEILGWVRQSWTRDKDFDRVERPREAKSLVAGSVKLQMAWFPSRRYMYWHAVSSEPMTRTKCSPSLFIHGDRGFNPYCFELPALQI